MKCIHASAQVFQVLIIDDDVVCMREPHSAIGLSAHDVLHLLAGVIVPLHCPLQLRLLRCIDHQHALTPCVLPGFDQQGIYEDGIGRCRAGEIAAQVLIDQ